MARAGEGAGHNGLTVFIGESANEAAPQAVSETVRHFITQGAPRPQREGLKGMGHDLVSTRFP
jgi:hypothetical protein